MTAPAHRAPCLPITILALATTAMGQNLTLKSVVTAAPIVVTARADRTTATSARLPAGADVTSGFSLDSTLADASANVTGWFQFTDQQFTAQISASCWANGFVAAGASATTGKSQVIVSLDLPRPMRLRLVPGAGAIVSAGTPSTHTEVDIGNDGRPELAFTSRPGICAGTSRELVLELPAGALQIALSVTVDLPASAGGQSQLATASAGLHVEPAHVQVSFDGVYCGAGFEVTPLLDGESVRLYAGPQYVGGAGWIVFGSAPTHAVLPLGSGCSLLVVPEVMVVAPMSAYLTLPLGKLAPVDLLAQAVVFQPPLPWQQAHFVTSARALLQIR